MIRLRYFNVLPRAWRNSHWMADWNWNGDKERPSVPVSVSVLPSSFRSVFNFSSSSFLPSFSRFHLHGLQLSFFVPLAHSFVFYSLAFSHLMSRHLLPYSFPTRTCSFLPYFVILISHFFLPPSFSTMSRPHPFLFVCFLQWFYFLLSVAEQSCGQSLRVSSDESRNFHFFCNLTHVYANSTFETSGLFWKCHKIVTFFGTFVYPWCCTPVLTLCLIPRERAPPPTRCRVPVLWNSAPAGPAISSVQQRLMSSWVHKNIIGLLYSFVSLVSSLSFAVLMEILFNGKVVMNLALWTSK
jgi:hypothetical protein